MPDYDQLNTDLARHYRSKEEASTQAEGVDLSGDSLNGFTIVCCPLQFQHSSITWKKKIGQLRNESTNRINKFSSSNTNSYSIKYLVVSS